MTSRGISDLSAGATPLESDDPGLSSSLPGGVRLSPLDDEAISEPIKVGDRVGSYELKQRLGRGGMGVVYLAYDHTLRRRVVLKLLTAHGETARDEALLNEARVAANLEHERFVRVYGFDHLPSGQPFLVMEHLRGHTLVPWFARRPSAHEAASLIAEVAAGMAFAHQRGLVHRDLKPENIFLTSDGHSKILDLGLAGLYRDPPHSTTRKADLPQLSAGLAGTLPYLAPELWSDSPPGPAADVWALGVLLYQALTGGAHPYWRVGLPLLDNISRCQSGTIPPLSTAPPALWAITRRALAVDPAHRFHDASGLHQALHGFLHPQRRWSSWLGGGAALGTIVAAAVAALRVLWPAPEMIDLPGGTFQMGSTVAELSAVREWCHKLSPSPAPCDPLFSDREQPARVVRLSPFAIDRTEVTAAAFLAFAQRGISSGRARVRDSRFLETREDPPRLLADLYSDVDSPHPIIAERDQLSLRPGRDRWPIAHVTWEGARLHCQALGKRLPTEAEWEYAARGAGQPGQRFPFGTEPPDCDGVTHARTSRPDATAADHVCSANGVGPRAVGHSPRDRTPQGVVDLGGNLSEWVADPFSERYPDCGTCVDPLTPESALDARRPRRAVRGGNWAMFAMLTRSAARWPFDVNPLPIGVIGFRCARSK